MQKNEKRTYKGIDYCFDILNTGEYSVNIGGKDYLFDTEEETKQAIDNKNALMIESVIDTLINNFQYHNKNLTKRQDYALDDCIVALKAIKKEIEV